MAFNNNKIFDMKRNNPPFPMDQPEILRMTVVIRLSSAKNIRTIRKSLNEVLQDLEFKEKGNEITVSAYPPSEDFGEDNVLAIVRKHEPEAKKIGKHS